jgi:hypothetical protein
MILLMRYPFNKEIDFCEKEIFDISPFQRKTCDKNGCWTIEMNDGSIFLIEGNLEQYNKLQGVKYEFSKKVT